MYYHFLCHATFCSNDFALQCFHLILSPNPLLLVTGGGVDCKQNGSPDSGGSSGGLLAGNENGINGTGNRAGSARTG